MSICPWLLEITRGLVCIIHCLLACLGPKQSLLAGDPIGVHSWLVVKQEPCRGLAVGVEERLSLLRKEPIWREAAFGGSLLRIGWGEFLSAIL